MLAVKNSINRIAACSPAAATWTGMSDCDPAYWRVDTGDDLGIAEWDRATGRQGDLRDDHRAHLRHVLSPFFFNVTVTLPGACSDAKPRRHRGRRRP
jgi:hypothetical protein